MVLTNTTQVKLEDNSLYFEILSLWNWIKFHGQIS